MRLHASLITLCLASAFAVSANAADWSSDTVGYRYVPSESEPGVSSNVVKNIVSFTHVSGDKLGMNLFSIDLLRSNLADPANGGGDGAQEWYGFYKRSFSLKALTGRQEGYGFFKDIKLNARIDAGTKNTAFAPQPVKGRVGASVDLPVSAGFWDVGFDIYRETNHNGIGNVKYVKFDYAPALTSAWAIPVASVGTLEGFLDVIGPKGKDGFGAQTRTEVLLRTSFMFDVLGSNSGLKAGVGVESWKNKFGCSAGTSSCNATTPMVLVSYKL